MAASATDLGYLAVTTLASVGFASIAAGRVRLAFESHRDGNRMELVRSTIMAVIMSLFAAAAGYGAVVRLASIALTKH